jgi:hypothetical protein
MTPHTLRTATTLMVGLGWLLCTSGARADDVTVVNNPPVQPAAAPAVVVVEPAPSAETVPRRASSGPNMPMVGGGIIVFGLSYGTAVVVASTSEHQGDDHLYVPLVGPWIDFADRGQCGTGSTPTCTAETGNKVLLAVDGVLQALGVLTVVGGLLYTGERDRDYGTTASPTTAQPKVQITPVQYGRSGVGLAAVGLF